MKDLKIKVNSEAESKQAKSLLESLGFDIDFSEEGFKYSYLFAYVDEMHVTGDNREDRFKNKNNKEITLPQLRDLVVLKRNDVGDANAFRLDNDVKYYITSDNKYYYFSDIPTFQWTESCNDIDYLEKHIKPIEKPMKEYLNKETHEFVRSHSELNDMWIEIPEVADCYAVNNGYHTFFTDISLSPEWSVLWSRHTHPEELPFIDDEPKITTAKGSELDCIAKTHDMRDRYDGESDEDYRYQLEHYISRKEPSLNDQYAEIEKVRQTLNQRQEQYGSFEDVAMITEQMVDVMRKGYYENLAYNQKMALYMICSKMARIVNGNPNHKDSWHDIAGYATLIDNELVSEKDMPF